MVARHSVWDDDHVVRRVVDFKANGLTKKERKTQRMENQGEDEVKGVGLIKKDATNRIEWQEGVRTVLCYTFQFIFYIYIPKGLSPCVLWRKQIKSIN